MKLEVFDDKVNPLVRSYSQSKQIGAIETSTNKASRSGYYSSKQAIEKS
jgi:hypothetical protein